MRKLLTLLLCLPLIAMAFANAAFAEEDEVVTIQYYGQSNNRQSTEGFMNDYLEEAIGVRVEIIQSTNEKTQALLASGNLPDVGNYLYNGSLDPAIRGGLLVNLAEHLDQLPNVTQNVPYTIPFSQEYYGPSPSAMRIPRLAARFTFSGTCTRRLGGQRFSRSTI